MTLPDPASPFIVGVCGGTASGKSTVCQRLVELLCDDDVGILPSDAFYKVLSAEELIRVNNNDYDFDSPSAINVDELKECLRHLCDGKSVELPIYDFNSHTRKCETIPFPSRRIIIIEGILIFTDAELRNMMNLKVFVECDSDTRLARRVNRDISERGRDLQSVLHQYFKFVKPSYDTFVDPSKQYADIIIPNAGGQGINSVSIDVLVKHIQAQRPRTSI